MKFFLSKIKKITCLIVLEEKFIEGREAGNNKLKALG
jgi:hypothetical protein